MTTRITTILTAALAAALLASPAASAVPHDRVDALGSTTGVAVAAPADVETEFGRLGFTGRAIPTPEPVATAAPAEPEPEPEPAEPTTAQGTAMTTDATETRAEPAPPTQRPARRPGHHAPPLPGRGSHPHRWVGPRRSSCRHQVVSGPCRAAARAVFRRRAGLNVSPNSSRA